MTSTQKTALSSIVPSAASPITDDYVKARLMFYQYLVLEQNVKGVVAKGAELFPGVPASGATIYQKVAKTFITPGYS